MGDAPPPAHDAGRRKPCGRAYAPHRLPRRRTQSKPRQDGARGLVAGPRYDDDDDIRAGAGRRAVADAAAGQHRHQRRGDRRRGQRGDIKAWRCGTCVRDSKLSILLTFALYLY